MNNKKRTIEPISLSKTGVFLPTNTTLTSVETWKTETPYGTALVKGKLCQIHKRILNIIMYHAYGTVETIDKASGLTTLNIIFDLNKITKEYSENEPQFVEDRIHEIIESNIVILKKDKTEFEHNDYFHIIDSFILLDGKDGKNLLPIEDVVTESKSLSSAVSNNVQRYYSMISVNKLFSDMLFNDFKSALN
ncbi:hypothetical protein JXK06_00805 [Patescibacteria group bacterium]|nr:hypothetical protein [Patescibacteria group bacterium]